MRGTVAWLVLAGCAASEYGVLSQPVDVHPEEVTACAFEAVEGSEELTEYGCNPVFVTTQESWSARQGSLSFTSTPVMGHAFYQLWYVGFGDGQNGSYDVGYAVSADGTEWLAHEQNPGWPERRASDWDGGKIQNLKVAYDPNTGSYLGLYGGITGDEGFFGVGAATSRDGQSWTLENGNPLLNLSLAYSGVTYAWPLAVNPKLGHYEAYFAGSASPEGPLDVFLVRTEDHRHWDAPPTRIFRAGKDGKWDDEGVIDAAVVELDGVTYLFYTGFGRWEDDGNIRSAKDNFVGLATTRGDGVWERTANKPLPLHKSESLGARIVAAEVVGSRIHLWVSDYYEAEEAWGVGLFLYEPGGGS